MSERLNLIFGHLTIGAVSSEIHPLKHSPYIPSSQKLPSNSAEINRHLQWIIQKDRLNQDIFLIGPPSSLKRDIIMKYAALTNREVEYLSLSKDTTDTDLKQRREIIHGTALYIDQQAVRAALYGRLLVLDGIEKAERNVLPILNNLLENREMALDDGRFLVSPQRFDKIIRENSSSIITSSNLLKTHENFRIIALGVPVPKFQGNPLDPPFRSRFQARHIPTPAFATQLANLLSVAPNSGLELNKLISISLVLQPTDDKTGNVAIPEFSGDLSLIASVLNKFPMVGLRFCVDSLYPYTLDTNQRDVIEGVFAKFGVEKNIRIYNSMQIIAKTAKNDQDVGEIHSVQLHLHNNLSVKIYGGPSSTPFTTKFIKTAYHQQVLATLSILHSASDFCIVGDRGVGKSAVLKEFYKGLGYRVEYIPVYKDMSARDLFAKRTTTSNGDTIWEHSPLLKAAQKGSIAVLDNLETLPFGIISVLQLLIKDRWCFVPDGSVYVDLARYKKLENRENVFPIHPAFRIVGVARPGSWLTPEVAGLFLWLNVRWLEEGEEIRIIQEGCQGMNGESIRKLVRFAGAVRNGIGGEDSLLGDVARSLSTRQLIRICNRLKVYPSSSLHSEILKVCLSRFIPTLAMQRLTDLLKEYKIIGVPSQDQDFIIETSNNTLKIGDIVHPIASNTNPLLVPHVFFHENKRQTNILYDMLKDFKLNEHLLLIGNQGVGKNKIVDKFLQLLNLPREYIQLHRDSTVHTLTSTPMILDGVLVFQDSALVKAVREGFVLVVDEADKAPTHVTCIFKSLVEDGEMVLSDGRRIVSRPEDISDKNCILVHKNFRIIVLANRPGFPFLGNDFFREIGDVFACHCIDNPDIESEMTLLRKYAPNVNEELLRKISTLFADLRKLVDDGLINYPFSTREIVSIVKHLEAYPNEGLSRALRNVFDFDQYDDSKELIFEIMNKNGIPLTTTEIQYVVELAEVYQLGPAQHIETWTFDGKMSLKIPIVLSNELVYRGGWKIEQTVPFSLNKTQERSLIFTEQLYSFKLPTKSQMRCMITASDGSLIILTHNPMLLFIIDPQHAYASSVELFEFFPLSKGDVNVNLFEVSPRKFAVFNSENRTFLIIDFNGKSIFSATVVKGLEKSDNINCLSISHGIALLFPKDANNLVIVDFNQSLQVLLQLPVTISSLFPASDEEWIIQSVDCITDTVQTYSLRKQTPSDTFPTIFTPIRISPSGIVQAASISYISPDKPSSFLGLVSPDVYCAVNSDFEIKGWIRSDGSSPSSSNVYLFCKKIHQMVSVQNVTRVTLINILNPFNGTVRRIKFPMIGKPLIVESGKGDLITLDDSNIIRVWQLNELELFRELEEWKTLVGQLESDALDIKINGKVIDGVKSERNDGNGSNEQGSGYGNGIGSGQGEGSGYGNGSGSGQGEGEGKNGMSGSGSGTGPADSLEVSVQGRKLGTIDPSNFNLRTSATVPKEVSDAVLEMHEIAMRKRLSQIQMNEKDMSRFLGYHKNIQRQVKELRAILQTVEAKQRERVWRRNQPNGDLDDSKLIEGVVGERNIYKRRGEEEDPGLFCFPKRLVFCFDLSASMSRFNGHDGRLDRTLEAALLIMESFRTFEYKFRYQITGHSGDGPSIGFVTDKYPTNEKDMFAVLQSMNQHALYCLSGDNTIAAATNAIENITKEEGDDYFVLVVSDANLAQCRKISTFFLMTHFFKDNISTSQISKALNSSEKVNAFIIFIGSIQDQAEVLVKGTRGKSFACLDNKLLPKIMKDIFLSSALKN